MRTLSKEFVDNAHVVLDEELVVGQRLCVSCHNSLKGRLQVVEYAALKSSPIPASVPEHLSPMNTRSTSLSSSSSNRRRPLVPSGLASTAVVVPAADPNDALEVKETDEARESREAREAREEEESFAEEFDTEEEEEEEELEDYERDPNGVEDMESEEEGENEEEEGEEQNAEVLADVIEARTAEKQFNDDIYHTVEAKHQEYKECMTTSFQHECIDPEKSLCRILLHLKFQHDSLTLGTVAPLENPAPQIPLVPALLPSAPEEPVPHDDGRVPRPPLPVANVLPLLLLPVKSKGGAGSHVSFVASQGGPLQRLSQLPDMVRTTMGSTNSNFPDDVTTLKVTRARQYTKFANAAFKTFCTLAYPKDPNWFQEKVFHGSTAESTLLNRLSDDQTNQVLRRQLMACIPHHELVYILCICIFIF